VSDSPSDRRFQFTEDDNSLLFDGTERVGFFSVSLSPTSPEAPSCPPPDFAPGSLFHLLASVPSHGDVSVEIRDLFSPRPLSFDFSPSSSISELFSLSQVALVTTLCPQLVYLNYDDERSPLEAIEPAKARFQTTLPRSTFLAKSSSSSRLISLATSRLLSCEAFFQSMSPVERKKKGSKSRAPSIVDLHLLQDQSSSDCDSMAVMMRYDAIRPSEPSLDDSTHEDFEKNAKIFHAFYPRISVVTYFSNGDSTSGSMFRILERHISCISTQLDLYTRLSLKIGAKTFLPRLEPFHFHLSTAVPQELITLMYAVPIASLDWQMEYAKRLQVQDCSKLGVERAVAALSSSMESGRSSLRESGRSSLLDSLESSSTAETRVIDVHRFVTPLPEKYEVHLVKGSYEYYHYGQDGFEDKGWGCAYRSMQTLVSWILRQNLSIKSVPTHVEIQRMLVDMLDKPPSFVNSKQWIGAVEISMCLSQHWDVMCKILHSPTGPKVAGFTKELINHFDALGSPVMIGGSVLAYTILGIAVNTEQETLPNGQPDVKFLILDPHYTGSESTDAIIAKGWCAWHPLSLFKTNAFYNLCLPQTPKWTNL